MADVAVEKDTKVTTPEKKDNNEKKAEEVEVESKKAENGSEDAKENGSTEEKGEEDTQTEKNGDADKGDACCIKRKSTGGGDAEKTEGQTPEKKAKLDDKVEESSNGEAEVTKA